MKVMESVSEAGPSGKHLGWMIFCPACKCGHLFRAGVWTFNGNEEKPTFRNSMLVTGKRSLTDDEIDRIMKGEKLEIPDLRCHSFVTDGRIEFLPDCTHELKGQTVDLPDMNL